MNIEKAIESQEKAKRQIVRNREHTAAYAFRCDLLKEVHEPLECVATLKKLNETIENIWEFSDTNYYLDHIWNINADTAEKLTAAGFTEQWFIDLAYKLETLREILIGGSIDYKQLFEELYDDMLACEGFYHKYYEKLFDDVVRQRDKMENEIYSLKNNTKKEEE